MILSNTNGSISDSNSNLDMNRIEENLLEEITVGYRPNIPLEALWQGGELPNITLRRDIEFMSMHPIVMTAMDYYRSGIAGAEFWGGPDQENPDNEKGKPISLDTKVSQFVLAHCERFWQRGVPHIQNRGYQYGWAPGEYIYKEIQGMMVWSHMKCFHPLDGFILTLDYQPIGIRVKGLKNHIPINMHFASESIPAKGSWYAHRPLDNSFYGRTQLVGGWRPWRRLGWRDALEQIIDAATYRAGYKGPVVKHPPGESAPTSQQGIPSTKIDGNNLPRRSNRDVARQMIEWLKAGAGITLSSEQYTQAQGGGPKWDVEFPDHVMDVRPLIEAARYLEDQIMLGIGVPPELVKPGGTGSGYSGRSIPREAFLDGQQKVADAILQMFVEQVIKPLVLWNFGDIPFNVQCKSLLKTQAQDKGADKEAGQEGEQGGQLTNKKQPPNQNAPANTSNPATKPSASSPAMSIESRERTLDIIQRVLNKTR